MTLTGQVALVTGASRGIGRGIAEGLAARGAAVALLARDAGALAEVRARIERAGGRCAAVVADVTRPREVAAAVRDAVTAVGPVDLLVDNAGRIESAEVPVWESDPDEWWAVVETNVRGPYLLAREVVPSMVRRGGGRVVDLSSGLDVRDTVPYSAYAVSKAALLRLGGPPERFTPVVRTVELVTVGGGRPDSVTTGAASASVLVYGHAFSASAQPGGPAGRRRSRWARGQRWRARAATPGASCCVCSSPTPTSRWGR